MIIQTSHPEIHLKTWIKTTQRTYWVPDQDRPDGFVFTVEPVDLDLLTPQAMHLWMAKQRERYGATANG